MKKLLNLLLALSTISIQLWAAEPAAALVAATAGSVPMASRSKGSPAETGFESTESSEVPFTIKCAYSDCKKDGIKRCSRCKKAKYCSEGCQRKDWPIHKTNCTNTDTSSTTGAREIKETIEDDRFLNAIIASLPSHIRTITHSDPDLKTTQFCLTSDCSMTAEFIGWRFLDNPGIFNDFATKRATRFKDLTSNEALVPYESLLSKENGIMSEKIFHDRDGSSKNFLSVVIFFDYNHKSRGQHVLMLETIIGKDNHILYRVHHSWIDAFTLQEWHGLDDSWKSRPHSFTGPYSKEFFIDLYDKFGKKQKLDIDAIQRFFTMLISQMINWQKNTPGFRLDCYIRKFSLDEKNIATPPTIPIPARVKEWLKAHEIRLL